MLDVNVAYVELLGLTFSGSERPDRGLYWTDLTGWWGLTDIRGESDHIPGGHGRYRRSAVYRESRVISLTGHILASDNRGLVEVRDRLEAALSIGIGEMTVVTNTGGSWGRLVEVASLSIEPDHGRSWTKFVVDLIAPDPRRYGPVQRLGPIGVPVSVGGVRLPHRMPWNFGTVSEVSRLLVPNAGALPVQPRFEVTGGFTQARIVDVTTRRTLILDWPLPIGGIAVFDCASRRVQASGIEVTQWLSRREWLEIPAGKTHEFRLEVSGRQGDPQLWAEYKIGAW